MKSMKNPRSHAIRDLGLLVVVSLLTLIASLWIDPFARAVAWMYHHDDWKLDELFTLALVLVIMLAVYSWRRWRELAREIAERERAEEENRELSSTLQSARVEVMTLRELLPICDSCQRIQDSAGSWITLELYLEARSRTRFARGFCPDCARRFYEDQV